MRKRVYQVGSWGDLMEYSGWNGGQVPPGRGVSRNEAQGRESRTTGTHRWARQPLIRMPIFLRLPPYTVFCQSSVPFTHALPGKARLCLPRLK